MSATPSVQQCAEALGAALAAVGLRYLPYLGDSFSVPVALIGIDEVEFHGAFGGGDVLHTFTIMVLVNRSSDRAGIDLLEGYMSQSGASSIRAAIEADPTLGGVVSSAWVQKAGPPVGVTIATSGAVYLACPFLVPVHA